MRRRDVVLHLVPAALLIVWTSGAPARDAAETGDPTAASAQGVVGGARNHPRAGYCPPGNAARAQHYHGPRAVFFYPPPAPYGNAYRERARERLYRYRAWLDQRAEERRHRARGIPPAYVPRYAEPPHADGERAPQLERAPEDAYGEFPRELGRGAKYRF